MMVTQPTKQSGRSGLAVMHVVPSLDCGGSERILLDLLREAPRLGQRACVLCLEKPGTLASQAKALGADVLCVNKLPGIRLDVVGRIRSLMREYRPDVVHTHEIGSLFYAGRAARRARVPAVVHTEHGKTYRGSFKKRVLGRIAAAGASRFFCVSRDVAEEVVSCRVARRERVRVVTNGIDAEKFSAPADADLLRKDLGIPMTARVIGTVGRLATVKRQDVLLRAFAALPAGGPEARLMLVGDGPLRGELETLAAELGITPRIHFVGYQAEPERFLRAMDVFALTSESEGMPLAVLESWASGLPVVASRVGGLPEMIDDGRTGILFTVGDISALASALSRTTSDPDLATRMGEAGRAEVLAKYHIRLTAETYHREYLEH